MSSTLCEKYFKVENMDKKVKEYLANFRKELSLLRKSNSLTQKQVAEHLGIATQCYQAYESGIAVPTLQNFIKLSIFFDVSTNELLGLE